jgi:hypothetical protein
MRYYKFTRFCRPMKEKIGVIISILILYECQGTYSCYAVTPFLFTLELAKVDLRNLL